MSNNKVKYQMLPSEDRTPALEVNLNQNEIQQNNNNNIDQQLQTASNAVTNQFISVDLNDKENNASTTTFIYLPSNNELPSYEEVLFQKQTEANGHSNLPSQYIVPPVINIAEINEITSNLQNSNDLSNDIGTDCIFLTSFMVSFFFNWIGFFVCICLMPTMAGKYGALSGFGLSMVKWATIVRYQSWMENLNDLHQRLFFWIFILSGFYLFFRGLVTYVKVKYNPTAYIRSRNSDWWLLR